jgi:hypothetical protein
MPQPRKTTITLRTDISRNNANISRNNECEYVVTSAGVTRVTIWLRTPDGVFRTTDSPFLGWMSRHAERS